MALESFGTDTARLVDKCAVACHDLLLLSENPQEIQKFFEAGDPPIWAVHPGKWPDGSPCVVILLGVG